MRRRDFYKRVLRTTASLTFTVVNNAILVVLGLLGAIGISVVTAPVYGAIVLAAVAVSALAEGAFRTWRLAMLRIPKRSQVRDGLAERWNTGRTLYRDMPRGRRFRTSNAAAVEAWFDETRAWLTENIDAAADAEFRMLPPPPRVFFILFADSTWSQRRMAIYIHNLEKIIARTGTEP